MIEQKDDIENLHSLKLIHINTKILENISRKDLQVLAKKFGVRANMKTPDIMDGLLRAAIQARKSMQGKRVCNHSRGLSLRSSSNHSKLAENPQKKIAINKFQPLKDDVSTNHDKKLIKIDVQTKNTCQKLSNKEKKTLKDSSLSTSKASNISHKIKQAPDSLKETNLSSAGKKIGDDSRINSPSTFNDIIENTETTNEQQTTDTLLFNKDSSHAKINDNQKSIEKNTTESKCTESKIDSIEAFLDNAIENFENISSESLQLNNEPEYLKTHQAYKDRLEIALEKQNKSKHALKELKKDTEIQQSVMKLEEQAFEAEYEEKRRKSMETRKMHMNDLCMQAFSLGIDSIKENIPPNDFTEYQRQIENNQKIKVRKSI